jgi:hypothetical protein
MFKILLISLITFMIVIIAFLILMSFLDVDIITHSKIIENFTEKEPTTTGGATIERDYIIFKTNGSITFDTQTTCEVLIVGGGGGGGRNDDWEGGGGGGGGGVGYGTITFDKGTYDITIGAGGTTGNTGNTNGKNGGNTSIIGGLIKETSYGGGGGGWQKGLSGGSGGGGSGHSGFKDKGGSSKGISLSSLSKVYMTYYGNSGGDGHNPRGGGGGGGADSEGLSNPSNYNGGNGGAGKLFNITGTDIYYGGGGGGASGCWEGCDRSNGAIRGEGGRGGGGNGGNRNDPTNGLPNTGGGGGGSSRSNAGNGGSGIVIIKYKNISNDIINKFYTDLRNLFTNKKPWGEYYAEQYDGVYLNDNSSNKRIATTSGNIELISKRGNGASANIRYIYGGTGSSISWPAGSIPHNFTILSLTRYNGGSRGRILSSDRTLYSNNIQGNFLHGHWGYDINRNLYRGRGCVHYDGWKSYWNRPTIGNLDDWLCCIGKNGGTAPNNILFDGIPHGIWSGGVGGYKLCINDNPWNETSDWALSCVIIWDRHLEDNEMLFLNKMIHEYKETGRTITDIINNNNNTNDALGGTSSVNTKELSQNDQYNEDNKAFTYYPIWDSTFSLGYSESIKKNDNIYNYNDSEILTKFNTNRYRNGTFIGSGSEGEKISITFKNSFVLKKIIIIAGNERLNAPSEWKIYLGENNIPLSDTATKTDYDAIQGKSDNFCVKFYISNDISSKTYNIIFNKTLGGTQLNFSKIILCEGTKPPIGTTNSNMEI